MLKLMIFDDRDNAELLNALFSPYYNIVTESEAKSLREVKDAVTAQNPDIVMMSSVYSDFGWENLYQNLLREIEGFDSVIRIVTASSASSSMKAAAERCGAEIAVRPFEPLDFLSRLAVYAQPRLPAKDRKDGLTGLHKKEFTEDKIREDITKTSGTMFLIEIAKYSFAACHIDDDVIKLCSDVISEETALRGGTLGKAAGGRFIGFIPGEMERSAGVEWGNKLSAKIKEEVPEKLYISIGLAESSGDAGQYSDLYQLCDKALGLSRASANTDASYY